MPEIVPRKPRATASITGPQEEAVWLSNATVLASDVATKLNERDTHPMFDMLRPVVSKVRVSVRPGPDAVTVLTAGAHAGLPASMNETV